MKKTIKTIGEIVLFMFVSLVPALAQSLRMEPLPAATGPAYDLSVGYTSLAMAVPAAGRVHLNGLDVSVGVDLNARWGIMIDSNYVRSANVLNAPHPAYVLGFYTGPVFYPLERQNMRVFINALARTSLVDGAAPKSTTDYFHGRLVRFSYALGGRNRAFYPRTIRDSSQRRLSAHVIF